MHDPGGIADWYGTDAARRRGPSASRERRRPPPSTGLTTPGRQCPTARRPHRSRHRRAEVPAGQRLRSRAGRRAAAHPSLRAARTAVRPRPGAPTSSGEPNQQAWLRVGHDAPSAELIDAGRRRRLERLDASSVHRVSCTESLSSPASEHRTRLRRRQRSSSSSVGEQADAAEAALEVVLEAPRWRGPRPRGRPAPGGSSSAWRSRPPRTARSSATASGDSRLAPAVRPGRAARPPRGRRPRGGSSAPHDAQPSTRGWKPSWASSFRRSRAPRAGGRRGQRAERADEHRVQARVGSRSWASCRPPRARASPG